MNRTVRSLAISATLSLAVTACTAGEGDDAASSSPARHAAPVQKLDEVALSGDPMASVDAEPSGKHARPVGEVRLGTHRVIAYVAGGKCGISVFDSKKAEIIGLRAAWPGNGSEGSSKLPGGPYYSASGSSSTGVNPWASLSCGRNSMIIEYQSRTPVKASRLNGSVSVEASRNKRSSFVVIGSKDVRADILEKLSKRPRD